MPLYVKCQLECIASRKNRFTAAFGESIRLVAARPRLLLCSDSHMGAFGRLPCPQVGQTLSKGGVASLHEKSHSANHPMFAPEMALHLVKLACERPDHMGSFLSQWDCTELARRLKTDGVVSTISVDTVQPSACWDLHMKGRWTKISLFLLVTLAQP